MGVMQRFTAAGMNLVFDRVLHRLRGKAQWHAVSLLLAERDELTAPPESFAAQTQETNVIEPNVHAWAANEEECEACT